ncbi:NADPH--cytochrome P450 reductase [Trichomonascus vanleenenianus]|uniref:NADPH--hemoprotein reductase n=1 Tax=Trichomonascus vanleenenianus TaxID=2268995 RepID=UPI003ECAC1B4
MGLTDALGVDILDLIVLAAILTATVAYFTKGTLWARPEVDKYAGGLGGGKPGASASSRDIIEKLEKNDKNVVVFYGSQTGTAEDYASRVAKEASQRFGLKTMTADCEDYDFENLDVFPEDKVVGFVMATYGEGEPTDNAQQFYEFITSEDVSFSEGNDDKPLSKLNYVIFGLGNNTYEHFNAVGRNLDQALQRLGANRIGRYGEGDDGKGTMEEDYLAWKDEVFTQWQEEKGLEEREAVYEPTLAISEQPDYSAEEERVYVGEYNKAHLEGASVAPFNANNPCLVTVSETRELFTSEERNCIHLELDIADTGLRYTTGDHLAFWTQNSDEEVDRFLSVLGLLGKREMCVDVKSLDPTVKVPFPVPTTYDTVVRYYLEINGPVSRQFVHQIAPFAPSEAAKKRAVQLGTDKDLFHEQVTAKYYNTARLLLDISQGEQWSGVPFSFIIESINHLVPRYYSISSSSLVDKSRVSITAVVESVKPESADHVLKGVATNYILDLKRSAAGEDRSIKYNLTGPRGKYIAGSVTKVPVHVRHSNFKLPTNPQKPIIMVGPGTGIAPFRGFIHERAHQALQGASVGRAVLFSGCRRSDEDNLYGEEWVKHSGEHDGEGVYGHSNFLTVINAFSREGPQKVYVQHRMEDNAKLIDSLLKQGAFFYVCGDAQRMARDVQATLTRIISTQRDLPLEKAERIVKNMKTQNIYQEDVW